MSKINFYYSSGYYQMYTCQNYNFNQIYHIKLIILSNHKISIIMIFGGLYLIDPYLSIKFNVHKLLVNVNY